MRASNLPLRSVAPDEGFLPPSPQPPPPPPPPPPLPSSLPSDAEKKAEVYLQPDSASPLPPEAAPPPDGPAGGEETSDLLSRFRKMVAVGVPVPAVRAKMMLEGLDPSLLDEPT